MFIADFTQIISPRVNGGQATAIKVGGQLLVKLMGSLRKLNKCSQDKMDLVLRLALLVLQVGFFWINLQMFQ